MTILLNEPVHLIGIGCGGSRVARILAEKGSACVRELHAWDGQRVELGNVRKQWYLPEHIGLLKVDALAKQVQEWGEIDLVKHPEHIDGSRSLSGIVFVGVDKMSTRWMLWEQSIRRNENVSLMIEMRLDTTFALIHVVDPNDEEHIRQWERYWYPDESATTAGLSCGTATSLGPIADLAASLCVWQLVRWRQIREGAEDRLDNQIRASMTPLSVEAYQW